MPPINNEKCRKYRTTLLLYRDTQRSYPINMDGSFDHALACHNCYNWARRNGLQPLLKKYADDKLKQLNCPICKQPMKVNFDFKVAKCFHCDWELCWEDPVRLSMSFVRMIEILREGEDSLINASALCPFFDTCSSPSKKKKGWACNKKQEVRLKMCVLFYANCVKANMDQPIVLGRDELK